MRKGVLTVVALFLALILIVGCGGEQTPSQADQTKTATTSSSTNTNSPSGGGQSLSDLFSKADWTQGFSCDMTVTTPDGSTSKNSMAIKNRKMAMIFETEGQTMTMIADPDQKAAYMYNPAEKTALKIALDQFEGQSGQYSSPEDFTRSVNPAANMLGTETIEGKDCAVFEYSIPDGSVKLWVWQEKGFPLRIESKSTQGTTTITYSNVKTDALSDSLFTLPAGTTVMDMDVDSLLKGTPTPKK